MGTVSISRTPAMAFYSTSLETKHRFSLHGRREVPMMLGCPWIATATMQLITEPSYLATSRLNRSRQVMFNQTAFWPSLNMTNQITEGMVMGSSITETQSLPGYVFGRIVTIMECLSLQSFTR